MFQRVIRHTIDAGDAYRVDAEVLLDSVLPDIGDTRAKASAFWVLLTCSSVIAAAGVISNSTAVVIGAMVIAPLGTPMYGVAAALVTGLPTGATFRRLFGGILLAIALGALVDVATLQRLALDANPQILARVNPSMIDLLVAFATGLAGSMALVRTDISPALPGVAIAISLVPPLTVVGITLSEGSYTYAFGALLLFATNMLAIVLAGLLVFSSARIEAPFSRRMVVGRQRKLVLGIATALVTIMLLASTTYAALLVAEERSVQRAAELFARRNDAWDLVGVERQGSAITATFIGPDGEQVPDVNHGRGEFDPRIGPTSKVVARFDTGTQITLRKRAD